MTDFPTDSASRQHVSGRDSRVTQWLVSLPPTLFLLVFFLAPALIMLVASFQYPGEFGGLAPLMIDGQANLSLETYRFFFGDLIYAEIFLRSFLVAAATTLICLILAYPLALTIAHSPKRYRDLLVLLVILPFASNFLIRIYAWIILLGPANLLYTPFAVIAGMVYVHLPFMILPLYTNLAKHDYSLIEAAQDLGCSAWKAFLKITLPLSQRGIIAGSMLVFIPAVGEFVIPELLGGPDTLMIGRVLWNEFNSNRDWPVASAVAAVMLIVLIGPLLFHQHMQNKELDRQEGTG